MNLGLIKVSVLLLVLLVIEANSAQAQISKTPNAQQAILEMGSAFNGSIARRTRAIYTPLHKATPQGSGLVSRDIAYGSDPRNKLDVHRPTAQSSGETSILVFLHGGGFRRGNKSRAGLFYDNVLKYAARNGILGINVNYRLTPKHQWPSGPEDIARIIIWLKANASKFGGDANRIFLMGHSAGARHVAAYTFIDKFHVAGGKDGIKGSILVSGNFRANINRGVDRAYFGDDAGKYPERTTLNHLKGRRIPLFIVNAEFDIPGVKKSSAELITAICARDGRCPRSAQIAGHNHLSIVYHINTVDESLGPQLLKFIRQTR
jgi:triacylglycerol lipase